MRHQPLLTHGPWQCAGGRHAHTSSPSQTGTFGTISKAPAESTGLPTGPSPRQSREITKLHFAVKDFYLSWCYCELIKKLTSPHNASLTKSDRAPVTRCQPFRKGVVLPLLSAETVNGKSAASEALEMTQLAKTWGKGVPGVKPHARAQETWCSPSCSSSLQAGQSLNLSVRRLG